MEEDTKLLKSIRIEIEEIVFCLLGGVILAVMCLLASLMFFVR